MKIKKILLIGLCSICLQLLGQEIKLNQTKPLNKNPKRILKTKETLRITDGQGDFFFRYPKRMRIAPDNTTYIIDYNQLLRFNKDGKFLKNYFKHGLGPCELVNLKNYILHENFVIAFNNRPNKIIWFDVNGSCFKEFRIQKKFFSGELLALRNNKYYMVSSGIPLIKGKSKIVDVPYKIVEVSENGTEQRTLISFPIKQYVVNFGNGGRASSGFSRFISSIYKNRYLVLAHTPEYLLKIFDVEKNKVIKIFSRKYTRIKNKKPDKKSTVSWQNKIPKQKYLSDINNIFTLENKIWIVTSTENKKGTLVDVFDYDGNYLDCFYLKLKGTILAVRDNLIFVRERNKYENPLIVGYLVKK